MYFLKFSCFYYECEAYVRGISLITGKCNLSYLRLSSQINQKTERPLREGRCGDRNGQVMGDDHGKNDPILLP